MARQQARASGAPSCPNHNAGYLDAKYWDERFQQVCLLLSFSRLRSLCAPGASLHHPAYRLHGRERMRESWAPAPFEYSGSDLHVQEEEYDWFKGYREFRHLVAPHLDPSSRILVLGCGNSSLSLDLCRDGFTRITSIDLSPSAVAKMRTRAAAEVRSHMRTHRHRQHLPLVLPLTVSLLLMRATQA